MTDDIVFPIAKPEPRKPRIKPSSARQKGRRAEHKAAKLLGSKRQPLSGAAGGGDVARHGLADRFSVEVKARPSFSVQKYLEQALSDISEGDTRKPLAVLVPDRQRSIFCLYAEDFIDLLQNEGPDSAFKIRELARKLETLAKEIRCLAN
jgi:hypothetical protein